MNKFPLILFVFLFLHTLSNAQVKYYDGSDFPLYGKITTETEARYERLPKTLKGEIRDRLWYLGTNSAGLYLRFRTNSTSVHAKWEVSTNTVLNHMPFVGVKGLDLYCYQDGQWLFVNSGKPTAKKTTGLIMDNMKGEMREYMLYMPLYDGLTSLEIGVDSASVLEQPVIDSPKAQKPVVFYGTSITQGGCASRPGMAYTNILGRKLDRQVINLGFSGNGQLDYEIAEVMAAADASVFVLDFVPNVNKTQILEKTEKFVNIIRAQHAETPIIIVGSILFPHSRFDLKMADVLKQKNEALKGICQKMKKEGVKKLYYVTPDKLIGLDGEATVDGIHMTDLGFTRYSEKMYPIIRKRIK
ncbi:hydrolase [Marinilabiliaceae bacterium JC017]|nr:hydrolase [Marinilabiliaceae bacterium JC017]